MASIKEIMLTDVKIFFYLRDQNNWRETGPEKSVFPK